MRASIRSPLLLDAIAIASVTVVLVLVLGLPAAARRGLDPATVAAVAVGVGVTVLGVAITLLFRGIARPLDRMFAAAERLGAPAGPRELPFLGDAGADVMTLSRAAVAFERMSAALSEDRRALARKVEELTRTNDELAATRASLVHAEQLATTGRLAAGIAHEVGNPLGAIQGYARLARSRLGASTPPDLASALEQIASAAERIDRTLRDLLDFARPAPVAVGPIALPRAIDAALALARVQSRCADVEVALDLPPDLPRVQADEHHLAQVFLNLFLNAGDAMSGQGRVGVSARVDGDAVVVTVEDSGPGIPVDDLPRIFDPFFTTKDPGRGTGLGLAISHRIVDSFGGAIEAANGPGGGARFELRLRAAWRGRGEADVRSVP